MTSVAVEVIESHQSGGEEEVLLNELESPPLSDDDESLINDSSSSSSKKKPLIPWSEIVKHDKPGEDSWLVIEGKVYDVTAWAKRHPGGSNVISTYTGEDATEPFHAFHKDFDKVRKYLNPIYKGDVAPKDASDDDKVMTEANRRPAQINEALVADFKVLRTKLKDEGYFQSNPWFYVGHIAHILALEVLSWAIMSYFGIGWIPFIICAVLLATAQAQAGWTQHDYGHLSVFKDPKWNHWMHHFTICHLKCASKAWWNWRHFLHHAKPNVIHKDPDIRVSYVFVLGKTLSERWAKSKRGILPYQFQHVYWHFIAPPLLLPFYFQIENTAFVFRNKAWWDLLWMLTYWAKHFLLYQPLLGGWGAFGFYLLLRTIESHWFVYVTQMNHLPMLIDFDHKMDWPTLQNLTTCNVEPGWFNDWFSGHLNYQVEHHLFPTMPRHNYRKANVHVKELYKKHGITLQTKTLGRAMYDILSSLREYGDIWQRAYTDM